MTPLKNWLAMPISWSSTPSSPPRACVPSTTFTPRASTRSRRKWPRPATKTSASHTNPNCQLLVRPHFSPTVQKQNIINTRFRSFFRSFDIQGWFLRAIWVESKNYLMFIGPNMRCLSVSSNRLYNKNQRKCGTKFELWTGVWERNLSAVGEFLHAVLTLRTQSYSYCTFRAEQVNSHQLWSAIANVNQLWSFIAWVIDFI